MPRYIDADAFEKYFDREEWRTPDEKWWPEREIGMVLDDLVSKSDVVEVVRCKDCIHNHWHETPSGRKFHICDINKLAFTQSADFYCAYGERRKDG